jgi:hypothetical protein
VPQCGRKIQGQKAFGCLFFFVSFTPGFCCLLLLFLYDYARIFDIILLRLQHKFMCGALNGIVENHHGIDF